MSRSKRGPFTVAVAGLAVVLVAPGCNIPITMEDGQPDRSGSPPAAEAKPRTSGGDVALFQVTVSKDLAKVLPADKLHADWRAKFEKDPAFRVVDQKSVDKAQKDEAKGRYLYFQIGDATRVHLYVGTKKAWKSHAAAKGPVQATMLTLIAEVGKRDNLEKINLEGRGLGFDGKVMVSSTVYDKIVAEDLEKMAAQVKARLLGK